MILFTEYLARIGCAFLMGTLPSRVAAQIVSGIGFPISGGFLSFYKTSVTSLTYDKLTFAAEN